MQNKQKYKFATDSAPQLKAWTVIKLITYNPIEFKKNKNNNINTGMPIRP